METLNELNAFLTQIATAQDFARHLELHSSIIPSEKLLRELKIIESHLENLKLILPPIFENLPTFEKLIKVNVFQKKNAIHFILRIPLVDKLDYELYHLYPIPNENNQIIIPRTKYLLVNKQTYLETNDKCPVIQKDTSVCEIETIFDINKKACALQLIHYEKNPDCTPYIVPRIESQTIKIENSNTWILIIPDMTILHIKCYDRIEHKPIRGNYLLTLPYNCKANLNSKLLIPKYKTAYDIALINLPKLQFNLENQTKPEPLNISYIDLTAFDEIRRHAENYQAELRNQRLIDIQQEHTIVIPIILAIIVVFVIFVILYCLFKNRMKSIIPTTLKRRNPPSSKDINKDQKEDIQLGPF